MYGLAILSRYPLRDMEVVALPHINLNLRSRVRIALAATADTPSGPVRIINTHLDTRIELLPRIKQLEPALERANSQSYPVILGGDFNTNPCRWMWNMLPLPYAQNQANGLESYMRSQGYVSPVPATLATHDLFGMRLDWVFLKGFESAGYRIQPIRYSDHHAVQVNLAPAASPRASASKP
jgi:endonuclease/exonuclease/phosphatase family metal-dependent hydrolase